MKEIIKKLKAGISEAKKYKHDFNESSWCDETGILITPNEAKVILETLKVNKISANVPVSGEYCPICKSDDLVDNDDHYTKCCKCGFSFVG